MFEPIMAYIKYTRIHNSFLRVFITELSDFYEIFCVHLNGSLDGFDSQLRSGRPIFCHRIVPNTILNSTRHPFF